jgi:uncharacterized membrane protein YphA (DoxX/SURF4 family)
MKAISLLLLRVATGLLLVIWGFIKIAAPAAASGVSDKYYWGLISASELQLPLGIAEVVLGLAVAVGLLRRFVLPIQAVVVGFTLVALLPYIADPLGMYMREAAPTDVMYFPSLAIFAAALAQIAFREDDTIALDRAINL